MFWEILIGQRADKPITKKNSAVLLLAFITHVAELIFPLYPNRVLPSSIHEGVGWMEVTFIIFRENVGAQPSPKV